MRKLLTKIFLSGCIGLLCTGTVLAFLEGALQKAKSAECINNLRQISMGAFLYAQDHDGYLPQSKGDVVDMVRFYSPYLSDIRSFMCPEVKRSATPRNLDEMKSQDVDYGFVTGMKGEKVRADDRKIPVAFDRVGDGSNMHARLGLLGRGMTFSRNHGSTGGNVAFSDGQVIWVKTGTTWKELQASADLDFVQ